jgi:hypothetical protein
MPTDFVTFFKALWGKDPFPWQTMLAQCVTEKGWPAAIDLPTASGKTACLDIAVYALAAQAYAPLGQRTAPRRIWFVVDRRIVVDEAFDRAEQIAARLADENAPVAVRAVAERLLALRSIDSTKRPLAVGRLRGGVLRDDRWARIPSQAAILTSTVDQLGSRLLFRGYGHSSLAAPTFAGLAGNDSLILLDEAHCARPFLQTLRAVQMFRSEKWSEVPNPAPLHVAVLSATPPGEEDGESRETFPANEDERAQALNHPVLQARLTASKRAVLEQVKDEEKPAEKTAAEGKKTVEERTCSDEKLTMRWDPIDDRRYALMDRDPTASDNKSTTVWMANLLAYFALALFPCAPASRGMATACWTTGRNSSAFQWPIWEHPLEKETARSLLTHCAFASPDFEGERTVLRTELRARGVSTVFSARRIQVGNPPLHKINFSPALAL